MIIFSQAERLKGGDKYSKKRENGNSYAFITPKTAVFRIFIKLGKNFIYFKGEEIEIHCETGLCSPEKNHCNEKNVHQKIIHNNLSLF